MNEIPLGEILEWKYGPVASTAGGKIVVWRHPSIAQPDEVQIAADRAEYVAHLAANVYREKRSAEYPTVQEQIEALWEAVKVLRDAIKNADGIGDFPPDVVAVLAKIDAIKSKYPNPEGEK